jgi:hypothetical protein
VPTNDEVVEAGGSLIGVRVVTKLQLTTYDKTCNVGERL